MSAVFETIMIMNNSFSSRLIKGKEAEDRVAQFVSHYGFSVDCIGPIGNERIPMSYFRDKTGALVKQKSPDLTIERAGWPAITIEVKNKSLVRGEWWIDVSRLHYIHKWSQLKQRLVLWVFENQSHNRDLICASTGKLLDSYTTYNPNSKNYDTGELQPTYLYAQSVFVPLERVLTAGLECLQVSYNMYLPDSDTGELLI